MMGKLLLILATKDVANFSVKDFVDFSKAVDTVSCNIIIDKLMKSRPCKGGLKIDWNAGLWSAAWSLAGDSQ